MTAIGLVGTAGPPATARPFLRPATIAVTLLALTVFIWLAQWVISTGFARRDIEALQAGEAWRTGDWLSQVVLWVVAHVWGPAQQEMILSLAAAVAAGLLFGLLYHRVRANGWFWLGAVTILLALASHAQVLYAITASSRDMPLYFAFAALIAAVRSLEDVGDVQAAIGFGLLLPLLLLAGPVATMLVLPLGVLAALSDPDGRRDLRAFVAMLLVALLPTIIVAIGILGFLVQARMDLVGVLLPYAATFGFIEIGDIAGSLSTLVVFAPVLLVPLLYCVWPNLPERRHVLSALAVIAMPLYLAVARAVFSTEMEAFVPAVAMLAAFASWLAVARLPLTLRAFALAMLALSVILSWMQIGYWDDPEWKAALLSALRNFGPFAGV